MWSNAIRAGVRRATAISSLYRRWRAATVGSRTEFTEDTVTQAADFPSFTTELFLDVDLLDRGLESVNAMRSLEMGCGFGRLSPWIARYAADHYGVDIEPALVRLADQQQPAFSYAQGRAQELPFRDDTFELTVSWAVLMHLPSGEIDRAADELRRVTAPDGVIVVSERIGDPVEGLPNLRPLATYRQLFEPRNAVRTLDRPMREPHWDDDHRNVLLRFE